MNILLLMVREKLVVVERVQRLTRVFEFLLLCEDRWTLQLTKRGERQEQQDGWTSEKGGGRTSLCMNESSG